MQEVIRKRVIGSVVLIAIGVMLPVLLTRFLHDAPPDNQVMHVYELNAAGEIEPVSGDSTVSATTPAATESAKPAATGGDLADALPIGQPMVAADSDAAPRATADSARAASDETTTREADNSAQTSPDAIKSVPETSEAQPPKPAAEPASPTGNNSLRKAVAAGAWVVQIASFKKENNAQALAEQLDNAFAVFYTPAQINGQTWYRVRVGPFASDAGANNAAAELRTQGRDTLVLQVD